VVEYPYKLNNYHGGLIVRALIFTVSAGAGHTKAAEAIYSALKQRGWTCEVVDTLQYINKAAHKVVIGTYLESVKFTPRLYGLLYRTAETGEGLGEITQLFNELFAVKLQRLIQQYKPNVMVCTHPFPLEMISILKGKRKFPQPVVAILTDYTIHPFWVNTYVNAYVVPSDYLCYELIQYGISEKRINPLGIPVNRTFQNQLDKSEIFIRLGLTPDKPVVLVMGGGLGLGSVEQVIKALLIDPWDIQIIAVAGKNKKLLAQLEELRSSTQKHLIPIGYTDEVNTLMEISDIIVSKPGGLTVTEALIKGIPFAILSPIPGQEERNSDFLLNNGLGIKLRKDNPVPALKQILFNPLRLRQAREMASFLAKPCALDDIVNLISVQAQKGQQKNPNSNQKNDV
jgi:processive 1,2-diacylglycerol beta-glucosyltransferase